MRCSKHRPLQHTHVFNAPAHMHMVSSSYCLKARMPELVSSIQEIMLSQACLSDASRSRSAHRSMSRGHNQFWVASRCWIIKALWKRPFEGHLSFPLSNKQNQLGKLVYVDERTDLTPESYLEMTCGFWCAVDAEKR